MKRFLLGLALFCLAVFGGLKAWMRFGLLFPLPPSPSAVASGGELERIFGAVPPPRFRVLRYDEASSHAAIGSGRALEKTRTVRLVEAAGWRSLVWRETAPRGRAATGGWHSVGPVGLFQAADATVHDHGWLAQRYLYRVKTVSDVQGSLFPLARGNRLAFTVETQGQGWLGPLRIRQGAMSRYEYEVTGTTDRWPSVPGEVFVIVRTVSAQVPSLGWEVSGRDELHYAPALGAVVFEHGEKEAFDGMPWSNEIRLAGWE